MSEGHRLLEQKALANVRALVDRLQGDDLLDRKRQKRALWIAALPIALALVILASVRFASDPDAAQKARQACELDAWNARAAGFERRMKEENPSMPYRDVQRRLERERPFMMAQAAVECAHADRR